MDVNTIINVLTPVFATLVTAGIKQILPKLPKWLLPIICTLAGLVGNVVANYLDSNPKNIPLAVSLGLAGIGLREIKDQFTPSTVSEAKGTVAAAQDNLYDAESKARKNPQPPSMG